MAKPRPRVRVHHGDGGVQLLVDGTFASFYRPGSESTGSVWDAIAAPILSLPPARRRRVLILGLGGGSAARVVRAIAPRAEIVGVEFDPEVVRVARDHLGLDTLGVELVIGDALAFLREDSRRFDLVLEDVFIGDGDGVHKPAWFPTPGHELAADRLARGGVLVSNALDEGPRIGRALAKRFPSVVRIEVEDFDNRIYAAGPVALDARSLRAAVAAEPVLAPTLPLLHFRTLSDS